MTVRPRGQETQYDWETASEMKPCRALKGEAAYQCALKGAFDKQGQRIAYLRLRYGLNASAYAGAPGVYGHDSSFPAERDLEDFLYSAQSFPDLKAPDGYLPLLDENGVDTGLNISSRAYNNDDGYVAAAGILFFRTWRKPDRTRENRRYTVFHEVAHVVSAHLGYLDDTPEWQAISGWETRSKAKTEKKSGKVTHTFEKVSHAARDGCMTSYYGATNPMEDFAESVSAYRFNPKPFRDNPACKAKYDFIKDKVFRGQEFYPGESGCTATSF